VHQHDGAVGRLAGAAGIEAIIERRAVACLEALHVGQLGEVPLRHSRDGFAGGQHRRGGRRIESDDAGKGADDHQDEHAKGDEDPAKHGCIFAPALRPIHRLCANEQRFRDFTPVAHSRCVNGPGKAL
jgi:hypothetical protein